MKVQVIDNNSIFKFQDLLGICPSKDSEGYKNTSRENNKTQMDDGFFLEVKGLL